MCNVSHSNHVQRNVRVCISGSVSPSFKNYLKRSRSANAATGLGQAKSTKSNPAPAGEASSTRLISLLSVMRATTGSQPTPPKPTKKAGSNTPGNDPDQYREVEHLLNLGLWEQAEEAFVKILKGKR